MNVDFYIALYSVHYLLFMFITHTVNKTKIVKKYASDSSNVLPQISQPHLVSFFFLVTSVETESC